jgi:hypothetical protein
MTTILRTDVGERRETREAVAINQARGSYVDT